MAQAWNWKSIDPKDKNWTLPKFIALVNVRLNDLQNKLAGLFSSVEAVNTFAGGATTPTVYGFSMWRTNNTVPTTITNFLDGNAGKSWTLWSGDANTTIANNANIKTKSGANIVMTVTDIRRFSTADGLAWREE